MKTINIKAEAFFELLKNHDQSMWEIFAQMVDGESKNIIFLNNDNEILFNYTLPETLEQLEEERRVFSKEFAVKLSNFEKN